MEIGSMVVLAVLTLLLALAVRSMVRQARKGSCAGCSEESCAVHGAAPGTAACPSMQRAMDEVEARLGD